MNATWNRVPPEQADMILTSVSDDDNAAVFPSELTEVTWRDLPFYSKYKHYRLTNYATLPCFIMEYLGSSDDNAFYPLTGLANTIYDVNDANPIKVTRDNVVEYLDFFFRQVQGPDGDIYLIKDPDDLPMLSSLPDNQKQSVVQHHQPITIDSDIRPGEFDVRGTLYYDGSLVSAKIQVNNTGKLSIHDQVLLLHGIHFPASPVHNTYMGDS